MCMPSLKKYDVASDLIYAFLLYAQAARRIQLSEHDDVSDRKVYSIDRWARSHMHWDPHAHGDTDSSRHRARRNGDDSSDMPRAQLSLDRSSSSSSDSDDHLSAREDRHVELRQQDDAPLQKDDVQQQQQQQQQPSPRSFLSSAGDQASKAKLLAEVRAGEQAYAKLNSHEPAAAQQELAQTPESSYQKAAPEEAQAAAPQQQAPQYFETPNGQIVQLASNEQGASTQLAGSQQYFLTPSGQIVAEPATLQAPQNAALAQQQQMNMVPASQSQSLSEDSEALDGSVGMVHADALEDPTMQPENSYTLTGTAYNQDVTMPAKYIPVNKVQVLTYSCLCVCVRTCVCAWVRVHRYAW
jgi:hypothetical protein